MLENLPALTTPVQSAGLKTFEQLDLGYGFVVYETELHAGYPEGLPLRIFGLHDRMQVFVDGEYKGYYQRDVESDFIQLATGDKPAKLSLVVENMGRNNTGPHLRDEKGILEEVRWGIPNLFHWTHWPLALKDLSKLSYTAEGTKEAPAFYKATFTLDAIQDGHLVMENCEKGMVWVNGFNLGRYWKIGPQQSLYLPADLLKEGENEIIVLDLMGGKAEDNRVRFADRPQWDITE
jgi:beta-galactosidase